ncbi:MAG: FAD-binding oxidoreductase [Candidatus Margulisbacteria bacterium]|nr:FAD-binding oxidoreductase [Candidatus Margulisiibacteriota bacterium]
MIIIIGGGIIGVSIAFHLAQAGIKDIVLIEKEKLLGTGATQYCSGGVRHQFTTPINVLFSIESMETLNALANKIDYKKYGYLILDMETDSLPRVKMQNELGVDSQYLTPTQIKEKFPFLNIDGVLSGSFFSEDGIADPASLLEYYEKEAKRAGVTFKLETTVEEILKDDNKVTGVKTNKETIKSDCVILAAGVDSPPLCLSLGLSLVMNKRRKYVLVIDGFKKPFPLVMEIPTGWYIKKEGDDALVGMSGKLEEVDYEKQEESTEETIEATMHRVKGLEDAGVKKVLSSMSDETPDKHAVIDQPIPGLIICTGFSGHGFMHSPAAGRIVAQMVKGEKPCIDISCLKLDRTPIKECIAI